MGDTEGARSDIGQNLQCSQGTSSSAYLKQTLPMNHLNIPQLNSTQFRSRHFPPNVFADGKKIGIPPSHPHQIPPISQYSQIPIPRQVNQQYVSHNHTSGPTHSRSLSQSSFFSLDSLPPLSPSPFRDSPTSSISDQVSADASMEERDASSHSLLPPSPYPKGHFSKSGDSFPPRKAHRRSNSDISFGFSTVMQSSLPLLPLKGGSGSLERSVSGKDNFPMAKPSHYVKKECDWERCGDENAEVMGERKSEGDVMDDLFSAYMNLDNIDSLNSSGTDDKNGIENREDLDSRASGTKTNGGDSSDNEAESSVIENGGTNQRPAMSSSSEKREGIKRSAGGDVAPTIRHYRSVSMDSFMGKLQFGEESPKMPPSPGAHPNHLSPSNLVDGSTPFSLEFGNGEFSGAEMKKIMANDKLAEIALTDPKRVKRILANRQSAARSKERKTRYISELEHKVQTLQAEATTLSAQLTLLQRDSVGLTNQNNELKFRLQSMEQQAQLRDALNEALMTEVQRLKLATTDISGQQTSMFQMQHQTSELNAHHPRQNGAASAKPESVQ